MSGFILHPQALHDLDQIWEFIAADSMDAADAWIERLFQRFAELPSFPNQGVRRPDLTVLPLRFVVVGQYLVAYVPNARPLWILAVLHGKRSPGELSAILSERQSPT